MDAFATPGHVISPILSVFSQPTSDPCPQSSPHRGSAIKTDFDTAASWQLLEGQPHHDARERGRYDGGTGVRVALSPSPGAVRSSSSRPAPPSAHYPEGTSPSTHDLRWGCHARFDLTSSTSLSPVHCLQRPSGTTPVRAGWAPQPSRAITWSENPHSYKGLLQSTPSLSGARSDSLEPVSKRCDSFALLSPPQHCTSSLSPQHQAVAPADHDLQVNRCHRGNLACGSGFSFLESPVGGRKHSQVRMKLRSSGQDPAQACKSGVSPCLATSAECGSSNYCVRIGM